MKSILFVASVCAAALLSAPALAEDAPVSVSLSAHTVSVDDSGVEVLQPATVANPGDIIEYQLSYKNVSTTALEGFVINGAIPDQTVLFAAPDQPTSDARLEAHVDGIGWDNPPILRTIVLEDGTVEKVVVPPSEFTALRWTFSDSMAAGASIEARYRVQVND